MTGKESDAEETDAGNDISTIEDRAAAVLRERQGSQLTPPDEVSADDPTTDQPVDLDDPACYFNRELSELAFQRRVLHEAQDERNPLLERVKFLAILTTNLDEFFMKRVGGLDQQIDAGVTEPTPDGMTPRQQWSAVMDAGRELLAAQAACYREKLQPALAEAGIEICDYDALSERKRDQMRTYFEESVHSTLTPLTFDPAHPFPFISNRSLSLGVLTQAPDDDEPKFSRVKIPPNRPRLVEFDDDQFVRLEQVVGANLDVLFPKSEILGYTLFRVTRNAEVRRNQAVAEDLIERIEDVLRQRRFATVVRLEIQPEAHERIRSILKSQLELREAEVFELEGPLDYRDFVRIAELDRPPLRREKWIPQPHPRLADAENIFDVLRSRDVLVHHPYHSFAGTVERFLREAAQDPDVLAIKIAIYRTAKDSKVIESLIEAARNGKQVAAMIELKARFDEERNLEWVERLEEEGIHVAYGTQGYKTHTKTALVVREEAESVQLYSHVGTGNYHSETAKTYVDLGLLTADRAIGQDLTKLFHYFTGQTMHEDYEKLLVAPTNLRDALTERIHQEVAVAKNGGDARIVLKANRLEDPALVRELYEASQAGVVVECLIRDICRLRPGVDGASENISVYSVVGRFLEHSRIFYFENDSPGYYIGSADVMARNLDNRVEAVAPVEDDQLQSELERILEVSLTDNRHRWELHADGRYEQLQPRKDDPPRSTHEVLMDRAREGEF
jgi:polyphosphate kinase